jgi:hypothetical protein
MSRIAHVVARAVADDPQTLAVLSLADAMRDGEPERAAVFAADAGDDVDGVEPLARLAAGDAGLLVYHQRGAAPALVSRLAERGAQLAVAHGDAAPEPLVLRDLRMLAAAGAIGLATTSSGASRLDDLGFGIVRRVPPVVAGERLAAVEAYAPTTHHLDVSLHGPLILSVDDLSTSADAARVVQAYHVLRTYLVRAGHLAIAVPAVPETRETVVQTMCREVWGLRLTDAWVHRVANPGERAALTRRAAVLVTAAPASGDIRHALAAMAEGVPVVAPADASAADALGNGALLLPPDAGPTLIAEALADLLDDEPRRRRGAAAASRAAERFAPHVVAPVWRAALAA